MTERVLRRRHILEVTLTAIDALHVGGLSPELVDVDMTMARNGRGDVIVPGTSLAGVLRAALKAAGGSLKAWGGDKGDKGGASLISVFDARLEGEMVSQVRPHTSIDRRWGTPASGHLFLREVLAPGSTFTARLTGEVFEDGDEAAVDQAIRDTLDLLYQGIALGASVTSGLGGLRLDEKTTPSWTVEEFTSPANLVEALFSERQIKDPWSAPSRESVPKNTLRFTISFTPTGPLMSKSDDPGGICKAWPATVPVEEGVKLLLPGSSIKGALRTRAEHIARMMTGRSSIPEEFLKQMKDSGSLAAGGLGAMFGAAGDDTDENEGGRKGALRVRDVHTRCTIKQKGWARLRGIKSSQDKEERTAQEKKFSDAVLELNKDLRSKGLWFSYTARNAIDRWSGGASDGALFSSLEPYASRGMRPWEDIIIDVDLIRLAKASDASTLKRETAFRISLGVLLLTLKDMRDGWVPLGFGSGRGLGSIEVESIKIEVNPPEDGDATLGLLADLESVEAVFGDESEKGTALRGKISRALEKLSPKPAGSREEAS